MRVFKGIHTLSKALRLFSIWLLMAVLLGFAPAPALQADVTPPTVELRAVRTLRGGDPAIEIHGEARDDVGLSYIRVFATLVEGDLGDFLPPDFMQDCVGRAACEIDTSFARLPTGVWAVTLIAEDDAGNLSEPDEETFDIVEAELGEPPAMAQHEDYQFSEAALAMIREQMLGPDTELIFIANSLNAFAGPIFIGNCQIIRPVHVPEGPFTECPGVDISGANLSNLDLRFADFSGANLNDATMEGTNLSNANLEGASLNHAFMYLANLHEAEISDASFSGAELQEADLSMATAIGVDMRSARLPSANLGETDFRNADLRSAYFRGAELREAQLSGADLRNADLERAIVGYDTIFNDVIWGNTTCVDGTNSDGHGNSCANNLSYQYIECTIVQPVNLPDGPFTDCPNQVFQGANFASFDLRFANFEGTDFRNASFRNADLRGANFSDANLGQVAFHDALLDENTQIDRKWRLVWDIVTNGGAGRYLAEVDLRDANLSDADLRDTALTSVDLKNADLWGADLRGVDLSFADLRRADIDDSTQIDEKWRLVWELVNEGWGGDDLSGADLSRAFLMEADMAGALLSVANLEEVILRLSDLSSADLSGANLRNADLGEANLFGANLSGANLIGANLRGVDLRDADLSGAALVDASLYEAVLNNNTNLEGVLWGRTVCPDRIIIDIGDSCEGHLSP